MKNLYLRPLSLIAALGMLGCLFTACFADPASAGGAADKKAFDTFLAETNALHEMQSADMLATEDIRQYIRDLPSDQSGFTEEELQIMAESALTQSGDTNRLAAEAAAADVELLFRMFYYSYGGYDYFGGRSAFDAAEAAVLADIAACGDKLTVGDLAGSIRSRLAFVRDGHISIGDEPLLLRQSYYYHDDLSFQKDAHGYWTLQDGIRKYVSQANGSPAPDEYMKLSIAPDGSLEYRLGMLDTAGKGNVAVVFLLDGEEQSLMLTETVTGASYNRAQRYAEMLDGPAPVFTYRTCRDPDATQQFIASAAVFQQEPIVILDLRGNSGGSAEGVYPLLKALDIGGLGDYEKRNGWRFWLRSKADAYLMAQYAEMENPPPSAAVRLQAQRQSADFWFKEYRYGTNQTLVQSAGNRFEKEPHEGLVFVLMDQNTMSAGEHLLEALRHIDNVVFVGANSDGRIVGSAGTCFGLPNSKLGINFGSALHYLYDEPVYVEGRGFLPDIWVGGDALNAVLRLVEHYY